MDKPDYMPGDTFWKVASMQSGFNRFHIKLSLSQTTIDHVVVKLTTTYIKTKDGKIESYSNQDISYITEVRYYEDECGIEESIHTIEPGKDVWLTKEEAEQALIKKQEKFGKEHRKAHPFCDSDFCEYDRIAKLPLPAPKDDKWSYQRTGECLMNTKTGIAYSLNLKQTFKYKEVK